MSKEFIYISGDIEVNGPIPGSEFYSMLSLGACVHRRRDLKFYREFRPISPNYISANVEICKFSPEVTKRTVELGGGAGAIMRALSELGKDPRTAMNEFLEWIYSVCGEKTPVFVSYGSFEWTYLPYYFHLYCGLNPFGPNNLDLKSYLSGYLREPWYKLSTPKLNEIFSVTLPHTHHALEDALQQDELMENAEKEIKKLSARRLVR